MELFSSWNIEAATGDLTSHPTLHQTTRCKKGRLAHTRDGMDLEWRPPACLCRLACGQSRHGMAWGSEPAFSPSPISDETALCRHAASHQPRRRRRWEQSRGEKYWRLGWCCIQVKKKSEALCTGGEEEQTHRMIERIEFSSSCVTCKGH